VKEEEVLDKVFWPKSKRDLLGTLVHSLASQDMKEVKEISVSRTNESLEIFYSVSPIFKADAEKIYLVKMVFDKNFEDLTLNTKKTSPEISSQGGIQNTLDNIEESIVKMNSKPAFFSTGVEKKPKTTKSI